MRCTHGTLTAHCTREPNGARRTPSQRQGRRGAWKERRTHMTSQQPVQPVEADWVELETSLQAEVMVPVSLFLMCKTVVEDDQGALFLNGTLVQRIMIGNIPPATSTPAPAASTPKEDKISEDDRQKLKSLLFPISIKGPIPGNPAKSRRVDLVDLPRDGAWGAPTTRVTKLCSETLDVVHAPLDIRQHWYR